MGLRIAFAGTPDFSVSALRALLDSRHDLVGVLTQPDRPRGRGRQLTPSPVKAAAQAAGIDVSQPTSLKGDDGVAVLRTWRPDVLVVVAYGVILPRNVLELPRLGCLNIHASLLPRWRGAAPIQRAILAGDASSGVCIMRMDEGLDTGPVYLQRAVPIGPDDTAGMLHDRLAVEGAAALIEVLDELEAGQPQPIPQPSDGVTYAAKIGKGEALLDWSQDAGSLHRKIRAFNPTPVAETLLDGAQLRIYAAHATASTAGGTVPGTVVSVAAEGIVVACGQGLLTLTQLQRPGRKVVSARELTNTLDLAGRRLG